MKARHICSQLVLALAVIAFAIAVLPSYTGVASAVGSTSIKLFGYIKDMKNTPLANSYVGVSDENFKYLGGTKSNKAGYYEFFVEEPGTYHLSAQHNSTADPYLFDYIPLTKTIETGDSLETRTEFNLRPGGNIILHAYDIEGRLIRNKQFREGTVGHAYVTDLKDLPNYGVLHAIHDDYSLQSSSPWDLAIPAFLVPPQTSSRMHVQWEVPEFGKIMLFSDNEGIGYSVDKQGGEIVLNFNYEAAKSQIATLERDYQSCNKQRYSLSHSIIENLALSKKRLEKAEKYLSQVPTPDIKNAVNELNTSLKHSLWAHEQLQLEKAQADIDKYRKGSVSLKVASESGVPLPNCSISLRQISHDFLFGANPMGKHNKYDVMYADMLKQAGINYSYIICPWRSIEPNSGRFDWGMIDNYQNIQGQLGKRFRLMGGLALWYYRGSGLDDTFCPKYQDDMTFEQLKQNIYDHMYTLASRYKDHIESWEINEPNMPWHNALGLTWNQKLETYGIFAKAVKDANPDARILFDSCALPYEFKVSKLENREDIAGGASYLEFLNLLLEEEIPIDLIGLELYYSGMNTDGYAPPGLSLASISNLLDLYSGFSKPIFVRELSAPSTQISNSSWWHRPWDEETQAEYVEALYTIAFGKPLVQGIGWSYGVSDEDSFIVSGGLLDTDLNPKPSYFMLRNLINSWTTSCTGKTDENGEFELRGFAGDYEVTLETAKGRTFETLIHVNEQQTNEITIEFPLTVPHEPQPTPSSERNNIPLIVSITGAIVVLGLLTLFVLRKRSH